MDILHANWSRRALHLWAESLAGYRRHAPAAVTASTEDVSGGSGETAIATAEPSVATEGDAPVHPFATDVAALHERLVAEGRIEHPELVEPSELDLWIPRIGGRPMPSDRLASVIGDVDLEPDPHLVQTRIPTLRLSEAHSLEILLRIEDGGPGGEFGFGLDLRYWMAVARFLVEMLADQRFVPTLIRHRGEGLRATWHPWLHDEQVRDRLAALLRAMPPNARAVSDLLDARPWPILSVALSVLTDHTVRRALMDEQYIDAIDGRDPEADEQVAWLSGLLDRANEVPVPGERATDLLRGVSDWIGRLDASSSTQRHRLCLALSEPVMLGEEPDPDAPWTLDLYVQAIDDPSQLISAGELWDDAPAIAESLGVDPADLQEVMLAELGRCSRVWEQLEQALAGTQPRPLELDTINAYRFLREHRPILEESGVSVIVPDWWDQPAGRLNARLKLEPDGPRPNGGGASGPSAIGLNSLVNYRWEIAVGDEALPLETFERLARSSVPLVQVHGRWVEIRPDDLSAAISFVKDNESGQTTLREAIRLAYGPEASGRRPALPVSGVAAQGWIADLFEASTDLARVPEIEQPPDFQGDLRPYQLTGLRWLAFLDDFGLGACLADDMGLGKTIQLIGLLLHERQPAQAGTPVGPTLLVVPTSLISNWTRELERFSPNLRVLVHHGPERSDAPTLAVQATEHDVVITTYGLVSRDRETLVPIPWHRVVLDEAQSIKNPPTKQTGAIRAMRTDRRIALTGTPLENRLSELWSIMEFCNPGYLGSGSEFRRRFSVPIERHRDEQQAERLRTIVRPFILRRLKTDPTVISDLPDCVETKEFATLTAEQAALYESLVDGMLKEVDQSDGMQRRGLVLATLIKLKQICNHPAQFLKETAEPGAAAGDGERLNPARSGKCQRLLDMLEEVIAARGKALIFTQFRQMGHLLTAMSQHVLDSEALFLHGGTPPTKRQALIDRFQDPEGGAPIFVLSLKAGGVGLNLTAANHVFHFDRWWNPAVEKQATDRAFRIGQTRTVHVHKFVCVGTLEEQIDALIERKTELAENIIGAGEQWLTELSGGQLRDILQLRSSAVEREA